MKLQSKQFVSYGSNVVLVSLLFSSFFIFPLGLNLPQVGKYIEVGIFCSETQCPVPAGLEVTVTGVGFSESLRTDASGYAGLFGSGLVDGDYTISWYWNGQYTETVTIDCSQIVWSFDYYVHNPTITKHFVYDLPDDYPAVVGLSVDLVDASGAVIASSVTDASGTVVFGGDVVDACVDYYLEWTWGSILQSEGPISFDYVFGKLEVCTWEKTNYLEPKTCGI